MHRKNLARHVGLLSFLLAAPLTVSAADFSATILDGLDRPVPDASVDIHVREDTGKGTPRKITLAKARSDYQGAARARYDPRDGLDTWVELSKRGYATQTLAPRGTYVLQRSFGASDIKRIAKARGDAQRAELREALAGIWDPKQRGSMVEAIFMDEDALRPSLLSLVGDPHVGAAAAYHLALIGVGEDLQAVVAQSPAGSKTLAEGRWAYGVASALVDPTTEMEWAFLRRCALNDYNDRRADSGAIQTLRLIASKSSREILEEVMGRNTYRKSAIEKAIEYTRSQPSKLEDADVAKAAMKAVDAIIAGKWESNSKPIYNKAKDKAIIHCNYASGKDLLTYTATFHKDGDIWKFRGIRETAQAPLPEPGARKK